MGENTTYSDYEFSLSLIVIVIINEYENAHLHIQQFCRYSQVPFIQSGVGYCRSIQWHGASLLLVVSYTRMKLNRMQVGWMVCLSDRKSKWDSYYTMYCTMYGLHVQQANRIGIGRYEHPIYYTLSSTSFILSSILSLSTSLSLSF